MARSTVFLVRHAKAGERRLWESDDFDRPLSKAGWKQADALAKRLQKKDVTSLVSSPYARCMQTLEPLGTKLELPVRADDRLLEGASFEGALELVHEIGDRGVLCSHGDVIPDLVNALVRRGMEVRSAADWRKGTVWVLGLKDGRVTTGTVWPPPE